ncbi:glycosyltransferase [Cohnella sp. REN36]|uniref:MGDG synthase family glycosyltransferase n=1 Tax=Cohnella sp. REN36 TaxID=2887347 RepID=UPI001D137B00|nr:glycosyltransferase [Cohnella sp. REN36]MCC3372251.1 glycosyltransferase [Cohnella sp. REN36]
MKNVGNQKILILSGSLGDGHKQAASALAEAALAGGPDVQVEVVDYMEWTHPHLHSVGKFLYEQWMKKFPSLYGYLFRKTRGDNSFSDLIKGLRSYSLKRMVELLRDVQPTVVASTFPPAAAAMSMLKTQGLTELPTVTVITDHTDHNFWIHPHTDRYIVASEPVRKALLRKRIPHTKIEVTGIPIGLRYGESLDRERLRERHGLDRSLPTVLVMGGGLGMIDKAFVEDLKSLQFPAGVQFIVVCGRNRKLEQELAEMSDRAGNRVLVTGYIDYVHELMALSDLIVTKPGGLSTSEALALELPMLLYKPLPGQEKDNSDYLVGTGAAIEAGNEAELMERMVRILENPSLLGAMKSRAAMFKPEAPALNALQAILGTRTVTIPLREEYFQSAYAEA